MDILNWPILYNLRFLVAGKQERTKNFIKHNYNKHKCSSVLDLGCGTGDFAALFSKKNYLGVDINKKYIKYAKEKYPHTFISQDIVKYDEKKKFDCTIFISTFHHLSDGQVKKVMKQAVKLTKKIIIIVDLNPETDLLRKFLIDMDRGNFVRTTEQKKLLIAPFGKILTLEHFLTGLASQSGIVLKPKIR